MYSHHRSHGYYLAKKCPLGKLISELYGRVGGANSGLAGSQDISYKENNFFSGAILAGSIGIAVGTALNFKLKKIIKILYLQDLEMALQIRGFFGKP